jgi:hemolysin type calcium-binding protein
VVMRQWGGCGLKPPYSLVRGGAGPDRLLGSRNDDILIGGPGRDLADGAKGSDTCRAEVRRHCERR